MKLEEAIKRNEDIQMEFLPLPRHREWEAVQLGIEAIKRLQDMRKSPWTTGGEILPGETEK